MGFSGRAQAPDACRVHRAVMSVFGAMMIAYVMGKPLLINFGKQHVLSCTMAPHRNQISRPKGEHQHLSSDLYTCVCRLDLSLYRLGILLYYRSVIFAGVCLCGKGITHTQTPSVLQPCAKEVLHSVELKSFP